MFVLCACVHRQIGLEHMSLGIERVDSSLSCIFLRYESGKSPQCSDDLCYDVFCCEHIHKLLRLSDCVWNHNTDKAGGGWYQNVGKTRAQQKQRDA